MPMDNLRFKFYKEGFEVLFADRPLFGELSASEKSSRLSRSENTKREKLISCSVNLDSIVQNSIISSVSSDSDKSSLYRSKRAIKNIVLCNDWTHFVTFTIDPSAYSDLSSSFLLNKGLQRIKNIYKKGYLKRYILVPELTKKGLLHFHGFIFLDDPLKMVDSGTCKPLGLKKPITIKRYVDRFSDKFDFRNILNFPDWTLGFSVCYEVDTSSSYLGYLIKYIEKSDDQIFLDKEKGRRYFAGGDLERNCQTLDFSFNVPNKAILEFLSEKVYSMPYNDCSLVYSGFMPFPDNYDGDLNSLFDIDNPIFNYVKEVLK